MKLKTKPTKELNVEIIIAKSKDTKNYFCYQVVPDKDTDPADLKDIQAEMREEGKPMQITGTLYFSREVYESLPDVLTINCEVKTSGKKGDKKTKDGKSKEKFKNKDAGILKATGDECCANCELLHSKSDCPNFKATEKDGFKPKMSVCESFSSEEDEEDDPGYRCETCAKLGDKKKCPYYKDTLKNFDASEEYCEEYEEKEEKESSKKDKNKSKSKELCSNCAKFGKKSDCPYYDTTQESGYNADDPNEKCGDWEQGKSTEKDKKKKKK